MLYIYIYCLYTKNDISIYIYICRLIYSYLSIYISVYTHICIYIYTYMYIHKNTYIYIYLFTVHISISICSFIYPDLCMNAPWCSECKECTMHVCLEDMYHYAKKNACTWWSILTEPYRSAVMDIKARYNRKADSQV